MEKREQLTLILILLSALLTLSQAATKVRYKKARNFGARKSFMTEEDYDLYGFLNRIAPPSDLQLEIDILNNQIINNEPVESVTPSYTTPAPTVEG